MNADQFDAAKAALTPVATLLKRYHASLIEAGFSSGEAMQIVLACQQTLLGKAMGLPPAPSGSA